VAFKEFENIIETYYKNNYKKLFREAGMAHEYPFITPSSECYSDQLWDWDSWFCNIALRQGMYLYGNGADLENAKKYEQGCIFNFLDWSSYPGLMPIMLGRDFKREEYYANNINYTENIHKPCLAQHAAFLTRENGGDASWVKDKLEFLEMFINAYRSHYKDYDTGLYYFKTDYAIGVDNDPCTFFRPDGSSASIYLNCFMYKELLATSYLFSCVGMAEHAAAYENEAKELKDKINLHCWDERDGFYYSVDIALRSKENVKGLHSGMPRYWDSLIQRIGVWSGFLALWAGIASKEQAERIVEEHYKNEKTFKAKYGVRTLSKMEKMYSLCASNNPSNWCGPVWGVSNYLTFSGLLNYGYNDEARELAENTIEMFAKDIESCGSMHEYYVPETGVAIMGKGFQSWNYLCINMLTYLKTGDFIKEF